MARLVAAIVVGLVAIALCAFNMYGTWAALSTQDRAVAAERAGVVCAVPLARLAQALALAGTAVAHGQPFDAGAAKAAVDAVAETDIAKRVGVAAGARWAELQSKVHSLVDSVSRDAVAFVAAGALTIDLLADVTDATGLESDQDPDVQVMVDAALRQLPQVMIQVGQIGLVVDGGTPLDPDRAVVLAAARYQVTLGADAIGMALVRMGERSAAATLSAKLNPATDEFHSAVRGVGPDSVAQQLSSPARAVTPAATDRLEAASLSLSQAMLGQIDGVLGVRADRIGGQRRLLLIQAAGAWICVVAMIWLLSPRRSLDLGGSDGDGFADEPAAEAPQIALIGARELLGTEELVHVGRAVRPPQRRHDDAD
jgi:hypothetical protein